MLKLYGMCIDCGRNGSIEGLFVSPTSPVGLYCEFGEVLGNNPDVRVTIVEGDINIVSEDQDKINWLVNILGYSLSGYNPFQYAREDTCLGCGDEEEDCECKVGFQQEEV